MNYMQALHWLAALAICLNGAVLFCLWCKVKEIIDEYNKMKAAAHERLTSLEQRSNSKTFAVGAYSVVEKVGDMAHCVTFATLDELGAYCQKTNRRKSKRTHTEWASLVDKASNEVQLDAELKESLKDLSGRS